MWTVPGWVGRAGRGGGGGGLVLLLGGGWACEGIVAGGRVVGGGRGVVSASFAGSC